MLVHPGNAGLRAHVLLAEHGPRHSRVAHAGVHDDALVAPDDGQRHARHVHQLVEMARDQLEGRERHAQLLELRPSFLAGTALLRNDLVGFVVLTLKRGEPALRLDGIRTLVLFLFVIVFLGLSTGLHLSRLGNVVRGIQIAHQHVAQAPFGVRLGVDLQQVLHGAREVGHGGEHVADALLDALGDGDLAFAGQQLHGAHLAHVHAHAHGVGGSARFRLHSREGRRRFLGRELVRRVLLGGEKLIGIRRAFVHRDAHVIDHADDVFDLIRIGDIVRKVVVDLRIRDVALLLALGNELFQPGLLLFNLRAHDTSIVKCVGAERLPALQHP